MLKSIAKKILSPLFRLTASRQRGLEMEAAFWRRWMATRGLEWPEDFTYRFDPESEITGIHADLLAHLPKGPVKVLDVGAGPATAIGKRKDGYDIDITAVDPLADTYDRLLAEANLVPPVRTRRCAGEELGTLLPTGGFDWVHAQNCIDHARDPIQAVRSMTTMVRPGGFLSLWHEENEAELESWRGLHQWNFSLVGDRMTVTGADRRTVILDPALLGVDLRAERRGSMILATASI